MASWSGVGLDGAWLRRWVPMLRWLVIGLLLFGMGTGLRQGWIELRWGRLLQDFGVPYVSDPADSPDCSPSRSSARQAGYPSR